MIKWELIGGTSSSDDPENKSNIFFGWMWSCLIVKGINQNFCGLHGFDGSLDFCGIMRIFEILWEFFNNGIFNKLKISFIHQNCRYRVYERKYFKLCSKSNFERSFTPKKQFSWIQGRTFCVQSKLSLQAASNRYILEQNYPTNILLASH